MTKKPSVKFLKNKYKRWYDALMDRARHRKIEKPNEWHHVLPKGLGGRKTERVCLTFREHFIAHWLLTKFTVGEDRKKMLWALVWMRSRKHRNAISSWQYDLLKRAAVEANRGNTHGLGHKRSKETRQLIAEAKKKHNVWIGRRHTAVSRDKMSVSHLERWESSELREWMSEVQKKRFSSKKERQKARLRKLGVPNSEESVARQSATMRAIWAARRLDPTYKSQSRRAIKRRAAKAKKQKKSRL